MERKRARLPHSDSGRLIWPSVIFTSHGAAANAPIATSAIAAAWRIDGLILSAIIMPKPRPIAARVTTSNGSIGSCSEVFEMDIGKDIAYHIRRVWEKETAIFAPGRSSHFDMPYPIYALILAGGSGERFWPLSRRARPKQLLRLVSDKTLLEETLGRLEDLVPNERTLILTNAEQETAVRKLLGSFPKENIIAEPAKRDTAAAVALGTGWAVVRDHAATMLVLPADHVIANRVAFQDTLALAADAAEETGELVTIGIKPTWACPGYGYIEQGKPVRLRKRPDNDAIHRVVRFREKPNRDLAESFLRKGNFRWNAGMFVWTVPTVLREFNRHAPELADFISQLRAPENFEKALRERFSELPRISFDYAIMEKADRVLVVEAGFDWDDIGSWRAVANYFEKDKRGNAANRAITAVNSSNNIVFEENGTTIALLGVHDLIVVRTPDALLVCHRHDAERIKELIGKLPPELQ